MRVLPRLFTEIGGLPTRYLQFQPKKRCNYFDVNTEGRMLEWFRSGKNRDLF